MIGHSVMIGHSARASSRSAALTRWLLAVVAASLLLACGDDPTRPAASLDGQWIGTYVGEFPVTISIAFAQTDQRLVGSGTLADDVGTDQINVFGTYDRPEVEFTISFPNLNQDPIRFEGRSSRESSMSGRLNGSGYENIPITFRRQD